MYPASVLEEVKSNVIQEAMEMRRLNKVVPVSGERRSICLEDRTIDVVYYKTTNKQAPLLICFHGGGFLFGGCALDDYLWHSICKRLDVNLVSVEYRKSPEFMYRDALEDAYDATDYLIEHADEYGFDPERISVFGGSAGGNLATALCLYAKEKGNIEFDNQILMYPFLDIDTDPDEKGAGSLSGPIMYVFNELHCKPEESAYPLVSPIFATKEMLKDQPNTIISYAEDDNLRNEAERYARKLQEAGVQVAEKLSYSMPHGFLELGFGNDAVGSRDYLGDDVIEKLENGSIKAASIEMLEFIARNYKR